MDSIDELLRALNRAKARYKALDTSELESALWHVAEALSEFENRIRELERRMDYSQRVSE